MFDHTMRLWYNKIFRPYVESHDGNANMLWEDYVSHKSDDLQTMMDDDNAFLYTTPYYTCLLQPYHVGIYKPVEDLLKESASV